MKVFAVFIGIITVYNVVFFCRSDVAAEDDFYETKVQKVLAGDRIMLRGGTIVQYYGIEVPPLNDTRVKIAQLAIQAQQENERLVKDKTIRVEFVEVDDTSSIRYAYVFASGVLLNGHLLKNGYACLSAYYGQKEKYYTYFAMAQAKAVSAKKGLWSLL